MQSRFSCLNQPSILTVEISSCLEILKYEDEMRW